MIYFAKKRRYQDPTHVGRHFFNLLTAPFKMEWIQHQLHLTDGEYDHAVRFGCRRHKLRYLEPFCRWLGDIMRKELAKEWAAEAPLDYSAPTGHVSYADVPEKWHYILDEEDGHPVIFADGVYRFQPVAFWVWVWNCIGEEQIVNIWNNDLATPGSPEAHEVMALYRMAGCKLDHYAAFFCDHLPVPPLDAEMEARARRYAGLVPRAERPPKTEHPRWPCSSPRIMRRLYARHMAYGGLGHRPPVATGDPE